MSNFITKKKKTGMQTKARYDLIFYCLGVALPILQFLVFYVYLNMDMFVTAFRTYRFDADGKVFYVFSGLENFKAVIRDFTQNEYMVDAIWRGLAIYGLSFVKLPLEILIAYYIVKKYPLGSTFHIVLYLPGLLSGAVMNLTYKYFVCECIPEVVRLVTGKEILSLLDSGSTTQSFIVIWFFGYFVGVIGNVLLIGGAMNGVSESVSEAASLDGASETRQFFSIYLPIIFPTIVTFIVLGLSGFLLADIGLYQYYDRYAPQEMYTVGYYLTMRTQTADIYVDYPYLSAFSWIITLITAPVVLIGRGLLNKVNEKFE